MPVFYKIDRGRRLILTSGSGPLTFDEAFSYQQRLFSDPDFDPSYSQIADFTQFTSFELSAAEVQRLAEKSNFAPQSRRAFIVPNDVSFGLARMFEMLRADLGEENLRVFRSLDEALDWVLSKDKPE
ncbi:MAG TPA: hypothetical protein VEI54_04165 [Candidatus Limnocylindrales bacterium]|nr:hypothetical protein [Candidatus Limnocylindrales bacterium]